MFFGVFHNNETFYVFRRVRKQLKRKKTRRARKRRIDNGTKYTPRITCELCRARIRAQDIEKHRRAHRDNPKLPCPDCSSVFAEVGAWHTHRHRVHSHSLRCETCYRVYNNLARFLRHIRYGHALKNMVCSICHVFSTNLSTRMRLHIEQKHLKKYSYYCDICSKGFFDRSSIIEHLNLHSGVKPHQCETCGMNFSLGTTLRAHRFKKHLELFDNICVICSKGFATRDGLESHMQQHQDARRFTCDFCGKQLTTAATLREHRRLHTGEAPYTCPQCPRAFCAKKHLTRHVASHSGHQTSRKNNHHECLHCSKTYATMEACLLHSSKCPVANIVIS